MQPRSLIRTAAPTLTLAICAALLITACDGSSPGSQAGPTTTSGTSSSAIRFASCMRSHGIPDFPDPSGNGQQINQSASPGGGSSISVDGQTINESAPAFDKAQQQCQQYAPKGPALSGAQIAKLKAGALAMARCMRAHGVSNFPDPQVTAGPNGQGIAVKIGVQASGPGGLNPQSPAFRAAQKLCQPLMTRLIGPPRSAQPGS